MVEQLGILEHLGDSPQRVSPGADLSRRWVVPEMLEESQPQLLSDLVLKRVFDELLGSP